MSWWPEAERPSGVPESSEFDRSHLPSDYLDQGGAAPLHVAAHLLADGSPDAVSRVSVAGESLVPSS